MEATPQFPALADAPEFADLRKYMITAIADRLLIEESPPAREMGPMILRIFNAFVQALSLTDEEMGTERVRVMFIDAPTSLEFWERGGRLGDEMGDMFFARLHSHLAACIRAEEHGRAHEAHLAWSQACFWGGVLSAMNVKTVIAADFLKRMEAWQGAQGGTASATRDEPVRQFALNLLRTKPVVDRWKSAARAADILLPEIHAHCLEVLKRNPKDLPVPRTVANWFSKLTTPNERATLFRPRRTRKR